jgi:hypothetical protein
MIKIKVSVLDEIYTDFPERSRVWIYQASMPFTPEQATEIQETLDNFNGGWESHGQAVRSKSVLLYDRFVAFVIDDTNNKAGGCSIDTSVHLMKNFEQKYNVELFNRMQVVAFETNGELMHFDFKETPKLLAEGRIDAESLIFNNAVSDIAGMKAGWLTPLNKSWLQKYI